MANYTNRVLGILSAHGCRFVRTGKGSHNIWYSPVTNRVFTVVSSIDNRHTANGILKDAGIGKRV